MFSAPFEVDASRGDLRSREILFTPKTSVLPTPLITIPPKYFLSQFDARFTVSDNKLLLLRLRFDIQVNKIHLLRLLEKYWLRLRRRRTGRRVARENFECARNFLQAAIARLILSPYLLHSATPPHFAFQDRSLHLWAISASAEFFSRHKTIARNNWSIFANAD